MGGYTKFLDFFHRGIRNKKVFLYLKNFQSWVNILSQGKNPKGGRDVQRVNGLIRDSTSIFLESLGLIIVGIVGI